MASPDVPDGELAHGSGPEKPAAGAQPEAAGNMDEMTAQLLHDLTHEKMGLQEVVRELGATGEEVEKRWNQRARNVEMGEQEAHDIWKYSDNSFGGHRSPGSAEGVRRPRNTDLVEFGCKETREEDSAMATGLTSARGC